MAKLSQPYPFFSDLNGDPLENGMIYIGVPNLNPITDPITAFWDKDRITPALQPLKTVNGLIVRNGTPAQVYVDSDDFSILVYDQNKELIFYSQSLTADGDLRYDLSLPTGAELIGYGSSTVAGTLSAIQANIVTLQNSITSLNASVTTLNNNNYGSNLSPLIVDLHSGTLCGNGWLGNGVEIGGTYPTPVIATSSSSAGSLIINVSDASIFSVGQLICYEATPDGDWYSANIKSILSNTLTIDRTLPVGIAAGSKVIYFYANDAHPNQYGYWTIADDALRQLTSKNEIAYLSQNYETWSAFGGAVLTSAILAPVTIDSYKIPGATTNTNRSGLVTCTDAGQGVQSYWAALVGGNYRTHLVFNSGERDGGLSGSVNVTIEELRRDGVIYTIATQSILGYSGVRTIDLFYKSCEGSSISVKVTNNAGGISTFYVGELIHYKITESISSLNHGTHVLFGDSWVASGLFEARLQSKLPNANLVNAGISGNKASQMIARFYTDVAILNPQYVWMLVSTNDYYAEVTPSLFEQQTSQILGYILSINSQAIAFNASVGDATYAPIPGERLTASRDYAIQVRYAHSTSAPDWIGQKYRIANIYNKLTLPASSLTIIGVIPGRTYQAAFLRFLSSNVSGITIRLGYSGVIDMTTLSDITIVNSGQDIANLPLPRTDSAGKFLVIVANNTTAGSVNFSLVADVAWIQI